MAKKAPAAKAATPKEETVEIDRPGNWRKLQRHPLGEKFALPMAEDERIALGTDMADHGQHYDIILYEGMVLDGWNRYLGGIAQGLGAKLTFKEYTGADPAAVVFGTTVFRRRLSSVQRAFLGAKFYLHLQEQGDSARQTKVAKQVGCSVERMNLLVQMLRLAAKDDATATRCVADLSTNADITTGMMQQMLIDCKLVDINAQRTINRGASDTAHADNDGDDEYDPDADDDVDGLSLPGASLDDLMGNDDDAPAAGGSTTRREIGADAGPLPDVGTRRRDPAHRNKETPASATARAFRSLTEAERADFVKFAWPMLRPAVEAAVAAGRVAWPALGVDADAGKGAMSDVVGALTKSTIAKAAKSSTDDGGTPAAKSKKPAKAGANGFAADPATTKAIRDAAAAAALAGPTGKPAKATGKPAKPAKATGKPAKPAKATGKRTKAPAL